MEVPTAPNQRWPMDFVSDQLSSSRQVARFLEQLIEEHGKPNKVTCDNGIKFPSKAMFFWSKETGVTLGFIQPGKPT